MYNLDKNLIKAKNIANKLEKKLELLTNEFVCVNIENGYNNTYKLAVTIKDVGLIPFITKTYCEYDITVYMYDLIKK